MSLIKAKFGTGDTLTRFVQKCPKFCHIFVVTIFQKTSMYRLENPYPMILEHAHFEYDVYFYITCAIFQIRRLVQKKNEKIMILDQFFIFH